MWLSLILNFFSQVVSLWASHYAVLLEYPIKVDAKEEEKSDLISQLNYMLQ